MLTIKKTLFAFALLMLCLMSACKGGNDNAPLMQLTIDPAVTEKIMVEYSPYNDRFDSRYIDIEPDSVGNAVFTAELPEGISSIDASLVVGMQKFDIHLIKGDTLDVNISPADEGAAVTFEGKGADVSNLLNDISASFDLRKFFMAGVDSLPALEVMMADIDGDRAKLNSGLEAISDASDRTFYTHFLDRQVAMKKEMVIRIHCNVNKIDCDTLPEYQAIINSVNPDDEADVRSGLYQSWLDMKNPMTSGYNVDYVIESLRLVDSVMTTPVNRHIALNNIATHYLLDAARKNDLPKFREAFARHAADFPELIAKSDERIEKLMQTVEDGEKLPFDLQLETPDGKFVNLSELYGKVLYIDFWATWCGPCCGEIPYMEKLYKQMKGNDRLELISISIDEDREAWIKKLEADKPGWKQFLLSPEENKKISEALNINGIPRFVIIGSDGNFISTSTSRPSDSETARLLESLTK